MARDKGRTEMNRLKVESLERNRRVVLDYAAEYLANAESSCDLMNGKIDLVYCPDKAKWTAYTHLTTSMPWRGAVGRQAAFFLVCDNTIIGMVQLSSALAQLKLRDNLIGWDKESKWTNRGINGVYNIQTCVPLRPYAPLLTGKLCVYATFSSNTIAFLEDAYGDPVTGIETTSLYGKSSIYNRIPFFPYLGLTDGNSAMQLSDAEWQSVRKEYYSIYPKSTSSRQAEVKFQILDKLQSYYASQNKPFPYEVQQEEHRRGVYFGTISSPLPSLQQRVDEWRTRWLSNRTKSFSRSNELAIPVVMGWLKEAAYTRQPGLWG